MRSHLTVVSIFLASFGILLWTGEAAGFCASVFENQQGKNRLFSVCLQFKTKPINTLVVALNELPFIMFSVIPLVRWPTEVLQTFV